MGAELLLHHVWIRSKQEPDWAAARAVLSGMTDEEVEKLEEMGFHDETETPAEYREQLVTELAEIEDVWHHDRRTAYRTSMGPIDCLITGGISYGDSPDEFWSLVGRFLETPAVEAAGFFVWPS